eukprot:scaffold28009_cov66-Attheya_sp.AAC.2
MTNAAKQKVKCNTGYRHGANGDGKEPRSVPVLKSADGPNIEPRTTTFLWLWGHVGRFLLPAARAPSLLLGPWSVLVADSPVSLSRPCVV